MKVYPSWRYHRVLEPVLVMNEQEDKELGDEWKDTPAAFEEKGPAEVVDIKSVKPKKQKA